MPKRPTKQRQRKTDEGINDIVIVQHLNGYVMLDGDSHLALPENELQESWHENKKFLLSLIGKNLSEMGIEGFAKDIPYGSRPASWWKFEKLPEPRKTFEKVFGFGKRGWTYYQPDESGVTDARPVRFYEPQAVYLQRNDLLLPGEEEKISSEQFKKFEDAP